MNPRRSPLTNPMALELGPQRQLDRHVPRSQPRNPSYPTRAQKDHTQSLRVWRAHDLGQEPFAYRPGPVIRYAIRGYSPPVIREEA